MITYLNQLSAVLFYLLGGSFFAAYLVMYNNLSPWGSWWLQVADLPLALTGVLYGGTSLYLSVKPRQKDSVVLGVTIGLPLVVIFISFIVMNFWEVAV